MLVRIAESGRAVAPRPHYSPRVGRRAPTPPHSPPVGRRVPTLPHSPPVGRRVPTPPLKRGVTLVELMISMLILAIVCIAWLQIIGIQSARKEARRREAVERLAGMMDAFLYYHRNSSSFSSYSYYSVETNANHTISVKTRSNSDVLALFDGGVSPIGYQLVVVAKKDLPNAAGFGNNWGASSKWLVGRLYNRSNCSTNDAGNPFFTLPVCLGL